jgi:hypothetical protein
MEADEPMYGRLVLLMHVYSGVVAQADYLGDNHRLNW